MSSYDPYKGKTQADINRRINEKIKEANKKIEESNRSTAVITTKDGKKKIQISERGPGGTKITTADAETGKIIDRKARTKAGGFYDVDDVERAVPVKVEKVREAGLRAAQEVINVRNFIEAQRQQESQAPNMSTDKGPVYVPPPNIPTKDNLMSEFKESIKTPSQEAIERFEQRVEASKKREEEFFNSDSFQRVENTFDAIVPEVNPVYEKDVFGKERQLLKLEFGVPREQKSPTGRVITNVVAGVGSFPFALGGALPSAGEKLAAIGEAMTVPEIRQNIVSELGRAGRETGQVLFGNPEATATTLASAGTGAAIGGSTFRTSKPVQAVVKLDPRYVPVESTGIKFVESYTTPTPKGELLKVEGRSVRTTHVTTAKLPSEFVTEARPEFAGGFRSANELYNFYKAAPDIASVKDVKVSGYKTRTVIEQKAPEYGPGLSETQTGVQVKTPAKDVPGYTRTQSKPQAYLGYAGIFKGPLESSARVIAGKPDINILLFRDKVSPTPKSIQSQSLKEINRYQVSRGGETFVPAENIAGASVEGQLITPSRYIDAAGKPIPGYENSPGSLIKLNKAGAKFTYYTQIKENPFTNPIARKLFDVFGKKTETYKFNLVPAETLPAPEGTASASSRAVKLDVTEYNQGYYTSTKYIEPPKGLSEPKGFLEPPKTEIKQFEGIKEKESSEVSSPIKSSPAPKSAPLSSLPGSRSPLPRSSSRIQSINKRSPLGSSTPRRKDPTRSSPTPSITRSSIPVSSIPKSPPSEIPPYRPPRSRPPRTTPPTITPPSPPNRVRKSKIEPDSNRGGFQPQVRRRGIFGFSTQEVFETKQEAVLQGVGVVSNTAGASLRVIDLKTGLPTDITTELGRLPLRSQFTQSKKDRRVIVELPEFRIKTPGEKIEITQKGIAAQKFGGSSKKTGRGIFSSLFGG